MKYLYFETKDEDVIDNYKISQIANIKDDLYINPENFYQIRKYVELCKGIVKEIDKPDILSLIKKGRKVTAIRYYRILNNCTLVEAKNAVELILEGKEK